MSENKSFKLCQEDSDEKILHMILYLDGHSE